MPSNPAPVFTHHLTDLSLHSTIHPMGAAWEGQIQDNGHTYLQIATPGTAVPVYAPVGSQLERITWQGLEGPGGSPPDWALVFRVSCEVTYILTHITDPIPLIQDAWEGPPATDSRDIQFLDEPIPFAAGDYLGETTGTPVARNWDFGVYNTEHINDFIGGHRLHLPTQPGDFSRHLNSVCPYDFFTPELEAEYTALLGSILSDQPEPGATCRQGSRDVPETVAGTWWKMSGDAAIYRDIAGFADEYSGHIILGGIAGPERGWRLLVEPGAEPRPQEVTDTHCYQRDGMPGDHAWFRVMPAEVLHVAYGEGACPPAFPADGFAVYER